MHSVPGWRDLRRPGYFGQRRDAIVKQLDTEYEPGNWRLVWKIPIPGSGPSGFASACKLYYEESYFQYFSTHPGDLDFICSFAECIDNAPTNIGSGCNYSKQEAKATHIQDIAVRNILRRFGRKFLGGRTPKDILVIHSDDSNGYRFGPGNIAFYEPGYIIQPSLVPKWAKIGSIEDFWQSNKFIQIYE